MTADLEGIAEACRAYLEVYDLPGNAFESATTRLLWVLDGKPKDRLVLPPERQKRLLEILRAAGAHPSGLGSYEAANDANSLADELEAHRANTD